MTAPVQVAADLRAAADVLRRDGWTQGAFKDGGRYCLVGALDSIYGARETSGGYDATVEDAAYNALTDTLGTANAIGWNDKSGRTADEVIAALEAAAQAAEQAAS